MRTQKIGARLENVAPWNREGWLRLIEGLLNELESSAEYEGAEPDWRTLELSVGDENYIDYDTLVGTVTKTYRMTSIRFGVTTIKEDDEQSAYPGRQG